MLDGAIHPNEHGVPQKSQKRFRKKLLQADEQFGVRQDDGEPAEPRQHRVDEKLRREKDPQDDRQPSLRAARDLHRRPGRHRHAKNAVEPDEAHVHRDDYLGQQQDSHQNFSKSRAWPLCIGWPRRQR